jgi:uncharacterized membrane protein
MKGAVDTQPSDSTPERHWVYIIVACLSLVGLADAIYLTIEHITGRSVQCTIIAGCSEVLSSSYAVISGIPVAMIGAVAYFTVFSLAILYLFGYKFTQLLLLVLVGGMLIATLWFLYLQALVIKAFCQFCLISAAITTLMAIFLFLVPRFLHKKR